MLAVLLSSVLMEHIADFQPGSYSDLRSFEIVSFDDGVHRGGEKIDDEDNSIFSAANLNTNSVPNGPTEFPISRKKAQTHIARHKHVAARSIFDAWYAQRGTTRIPKFVRQFARTGHANLLVFDAVFYARLDVLDCLHRLSRLRRSHVPLMDLAAATGHLDVLQFLFEHGYGGCTTFTMDDAARNGHLEVVQWLHEHSKVGCSFRAIDGAAAFGHLDIVDFLLDSRDEGFSIDAILGAATRGHLTLVALLADESGVEDVLLQAMVAAAASGKLEVVQYCYEQHEGCCVQKAIAAAGKACHADVLRYLKQKPDCTCCFSYH
ncbi:Aste57867_17387 [Aphanomyces stellatus]|uniref:Aste57867_17387 protein n=1 Tax=Aphanomyces stellatus TaxID=120398 RepID=A0A485L8J2_9STRA|nr:hypothetical protein As57867_017327 [Aphanomyces stellatus]VFT94143.1 Aste57867_17387 [Aphanomyces stellatus]